MSSSHLLTSLNPPWRKALIALAVYLTVLLVAYWPSLVSMVEIWYRSGTFAHGFIIAPVSLWLIWQLKDSLLRLRPKPQPWFILPIMAVGGLWLMSSLVDVMVMQQLSFVLLVILGACALLGLDIARRLTFPLAFLLFMVPMGENLIPPMMDFTASSTVWLIRQSGIPVYQEGLYFSLPSGNWSVVEACSGIRYLIASITLGCLFAYLTYTSTVKRLAFVAISIIVPVLANTARAYMIVMIGHFSDMTLAVGVDHLIYGWLFFGLVIFLMFLIGSLFRDSESNDELSGSESSQIGEQPGSVVQTSTSDFTADGNVAGNSGYLAAVMIVASSVIWALVPSLLPERKIPSGEFTLVLPEVPNGWHYQGSPEWSWKPLTDGADLTHNSFYGSGDAMVGLYINQYINQSQGSELVTGLDQWIIPELKHQKWGLLEQGKSQVFIYDQPIFVEQARIKNAEHELLIWRWYRVGQFDTSSPYVAKALEALSLLSFNATPSARIYVVSDVTESVDQSLLQMQSFMNQLSPELDIALSSKNGGQ